MPAVLLRSTTPYVPLLARSGLLLLCALTAVALQAAGPGPDRSDISLIVLPALLLLCVAALASLPLPSALPRVIPPLAETLTAAIVVGMLGANGVIFLLYLLIPVFLAGLMAGMLAGLACGVAAAAVLVAAAGAAARGDLAFMDPPVMATWVFIFVAVGTLGAWIRRIREATAPEGEPAYTDAHRLLSELHVVARQLSLGLDPQTLATALADDIRSIVPQGTAAVLARSPGGRFVALVGEDPPEGAEAAVQEAWIAAQPVRSQPAAGAVAAVPVLMGERVVALVVIVTRAPIDDATVRRTRAVIDQSGPRLASAMLFDDVRRLATVDERMRLAREIHDGIAQDLASVGYALDDIRRDSSEDVAVRVLTVRDQLRSMVGDLRLSIFDLRTGVDDAVGLGTALSEYAQKVGSQSDLVVHVSIDESPRRLPIATEVELLRMAQEAITNVRRHARARNLWLTVTVEPPNAHIAVSDDGRGMRAGRPDSFGLTGMRERAARIGALLTVGVAPGGGTVVEVVLGEPAARTSEALRRPAVSRESLTDPRGLPVVGRQAQTVVELPAEPTPASPDPTSPPATSQTSSTALAAPAGPPTQARSADLRTDQEVTQ